MKRVQRSSALGILLACQACSQHTHVRVADATALSSEGHVSGRPYVITTTAGERRALRSYRDLLVVPKENKSNETEPQLEPMEFRSPVVVRELDGRLLFNDGNESRSYSPSELSEVRVGRAALYRGPLIAGVAVASALVGGFIASRATGDGSRGGEGGVYLTILVAGAAGGLSTLFTVPATAHLRD